jgi:hypothetical protein
MPGFKQIPEEKWQVGDYRTFAIIGGVGRDEMEKRLNATYADYRDVDLGDSCGAFFTTDGGLQFMVEHRLEAPFPEPYVNLYGLNRGKQVTEEEFLTEDLEQLLEATGIHSSELMWVHPSIKFTPHEVWRQDDNGNQFLVQTTACRADATNLVDTLTARGHKQVYWAKPATA